jgi:repressor LexA
MSDSEINLDINTLPARQKDVLSLILTLTEEHGYPPTLAELAKALGLKNRMTVHQHVQALKKKGFVHWEPGLNRSLRVMSPSRVESAAQLELGESDGRRFANRTASKSLGIPLAGAIAAGGPIDAISQQEYLSIDEPHADAGCFALKVKGDSMIEDGIHDGDYVIVKPNPSPRDGEIVVALLEDGTATLKRLYREKGSFRLQPANKDYEAIIVEGSRPPEIQGVVVGLYRKI